MPLRLLALGLLVSPAVAVQAVPARPASVILISPCPASDARFGHSLAALEMDGAGEADIAVGAWGEDAVYVFIGAGNSAGADAYELVRIFDASGARQCPAVATGDAFGFDVIGGNVDGDSEEELVVGAPFTAISGMTKAGAVYLFGGATGSTPVQLLAAAPETDAMLGTSVAVGDFNGDGRRDIAASAPTAKVAGLVAGRVHVFFAPFDAPPAELVIENPQPAHNGFFGQHLSVADGDNNGVDDLYVSAIGNTANGIVYAGQIFAYPGPIDPAVHMVIEDPIPDPSDLPSPRFGMGIDARGDWLAIGADSKEWLGKHEAGMGYSARAPLFATVNLHPHPDPRDFDYTGYRCIIADVVGDADLDLSYIVMAAQTIADPHWRSILTWDGDSPLGPPVKIRRALPLTTDHMGNGSSWLPATSAGGKESIILGNPSYDRPGFGKLDNTGRVVIYHY